MKFISTLIFIVCISVIHSAVVIDLDTSFKNYSCLSDFGTSQTIIQAFHSFGAIDTSAAQNILYSNAAGLLSDVYMYPCKGKDPVVQAKSLLDYLSSMKQSDSSFAYQTGTIWLFIETNPSVGCQWGPPSSQNCDFIKSLVNTIQSAGRSVGIYSTSYMWKTILGDGITCNVFTSLPVWYAHYDNQPNFDDWSTQKFGGWTQPTLKQYSGRVPLCGISVSLSYY